MLSLEKWRNDITTNARNVQAFVRLHTPETIGLKRENGTGITLNGIAKIAQSLENIAENILSDITLTKPLTTL